MDKRQNIIDRYQEVKDKGAFLRLIHSEKLRLKTQNRPPSYGTIKNNWFSSHNNWDIPEIHYGRIIKLLQRTIRNQKK